MTIDLNLKDLTPMIRELIREQLKQKETEERQRIKQEQALTKDTKEKPLTDNEIREIRELVRQNKIEKWSKPHVKLIPKDKWKY